MSYKSEPLYVQIKNHIFNQIKKGKFTSGDKLPSEKELSEKFNVSRITVRNALGQLEAENVVTRIPGKGTYVVDRTDSLDKNQMSQDNKTTLLGVILCYTYAPFHIRMLRGIEESITKQGYQMMLGYSDSDAGLEEKIIDRMLQAGAKGLIIYPADGKYYSEKILRLNIDDFPVVLIDRYLPGINTCCVYSNSYQGGYDVGRYLIDKGHKNIGLLSMIPDQTVPVLDRIEGFSDALSSSDIAINSAYWLTNLEKCPVPDKDGKHIKVIEQIAKLFAEHKEITAIFAINSLIALMAHKAAQNLGIRIPKDLEIVCFDNPSGYHNLTDYHISYVDQSEYEMGKIAVKLLIEQIKGKKCENYIIPCKLVSCE